MRVLYESEGKALNGQPFLTVKEARGYFVYAERAGINSIAFIAYDRTTKMFGLIAEDKPPLDEMWNYPQRRITAAGGSLDIDKSPAEICRIEVLEEFGFDVDRNFIHCVGKTLVSSQMSQMCLLYLVDVTGLEAGESEEDNELVWRTYEDVMALEDWKSQYIIHQARYQEII